MDITAILSFLGVSVLLTLSPGPDNLFVIAQSISHGRKAGIASSLGLCSGITAHTLAAALGISAILYQSNLAFQAIKYAGAVYLLYLAWQAIRDGNNSLATEKVKKESWAALYRRGILMNILNPKVSLFFLALLPQFVTPNGGNATLQMVMLGLIFMAQAIVIFTLISIFAGSFGQKLISKPSFARYINLAKAGVFGIIGIRLALSSR